MESSQNAIVYGVLVGLFVLVLTLFVLFSTGSIMAVFVLWLMIALVVVVLVYYDILDINKILDTFQKKEEKPAEAPEPSEPTIPAGTVRGSEVFHISDNQFTYDEAEAVCAAYGTTLATLEQVIEAYNGGAEWCEYGWTQGGMALYPTQKKTWDLLQREIDPAKRTRCGRPGVNGGYFNPSTKFGVNCFGFKPPGRFTPPAPVPGKDATAFNALVNKFKGMLKTMTLSPFSRQEWSTYDNSLVTKAQQYGSQFAQKTDKLIKENFEQADPRYVEALQPNAAYTASPYGLQGAKGEAGIPGVAGERGAPGPQGMEGKPGPAGDMGPTGPAGIGSTGPKGDKGDRGDMGPTGPAGGGAGSGTPGVDGKDGATGPAGPAGPTGPQGNDGTPGKDGATGPAGADGGIMNKIGNWLLYDDTSYKGAGGSLVLYNDKTKKRVALVGNTDTDIGGGAWEPSINMSFAPAFYSPKIAGEEIAATKSVSTPAIKTGNFDIYSDPSYYDSVVFANRAQGKSVSLAGFRAQNAVL
jgi:hypothetical protein